ncbi:hypothetical protein SDJN03_14711, partial [Cucurbita argyrosperma subsp. sororia]
MQKWLRIREVTSAGCTAVQQTIRRCGRVEASRFVGPASCVSSHAREKMKTLEIMCFRPSLAGEDEREKKLPPWVASYQRTTSARCCCSPPYDITGIVVV